MGKLKYTSNGTFTPLAGITTYNFVVIGGGGGNFIFSNGGNGGIVKATYTNITTNLTINIGGAGLGGGQAEFEYTFGCGGGLTQVVGDNVNIIAGGGGGGGGYYNYPGGDGCYNNTGSGGPGQGGAISGLGGNNGLGGDGGIYTINGGDGGAYNGSGNGLPGGTVTNAGGGGGGAGSNGITGAGGTAFTPGGSNGGGGAARGVYSLSTIAAGSGGGAGYGGGGGGGSSGDENIIGGAGGAGASIALLGATNVSYYTAPDPTYGEYGKGGVDSIIFSQPGYVEITWDGPQTSDICFPAGTPIDTDQGVVTIEQLDTKRHSINGQLIRHITKTVTLDKYLIRFEKDSIERNVPNKTTIMSKEHKIFYKGQLVPAYRFLDMSREVKKVAYNGEILYNVLLDNYSTMKVNNLTCETLHPNNAIAILYRSGFSEESKQYVKEITGRKQTVTRNKTIVNCL